jgi:hypothetical protein
VREGAVQQIYVYIYMVEIGRAISGRLMGFALISRVGLGSTGAARKRRQEEHIYQETN